MKVDGVLFEVNFIFFCEVVREEVGCREVAILEIDGLSNFDVSLLRLGEVGIIIG